MVGSSVSRPRESLVIKSGAFLYLSGIGVRQPFMGLGDGYFLPSQPVPVLYNAWIGCPITYLIEKNVGVPQYSQSRAPQSRRPAIRQRIRQRILLPHVCGQLTDGKCVYWTTIVHLAYQHVFDVFGLHISKSLHVRWSRKSGVSLSLGCTPSATLAWRALTRRALEGIGQATTRWFWFHFLVLLLLQFLYHLLQFLQLLLVFLPPAATVALLLHFRKLSIK